MSLSAPPVFEFTDHIYDFMAKLVNALVFGNAFIVQLSWRVTWINFDMFKLVTKIFNTIIISFQQSIIVRLQPNQNSCLLLSLQNPKVLMRDDAKVVWNLTSEIRLFFGNCISQEVQYGVGELLLSGIETVVRDMDMQDGPETLNRV